MTDLISREELKKAKKRIESLPWGDEEGNRVEFEWTSGLIDLLIDKAPPAEKTGRWIMHIDCPRGTGCNYRECSCCKVWLKYDMPRNSYCPNCGARMEVNDE